MAILHFINSKSQQTFKGMLFVLRYTIQDKKTVACDGNKYVSGVNCTPMSAYTEFNNTKKLYGKTDGRLYYHFVQSFSVDENISPQTAHEIALQFAEEAKLLHGYEIVVSTHSDRDHIHSHFVLNSVNAETGKKFHISEKDVEALMQVSDNICREHGLSVIEPASKSERAKPMSDREYRSAENGQSWKIRLEAMISNVMQTASSKEHFIMLMEAEGYGVKWTDTRKSITYTTPEGKACRDNKLHYKKYLKENMEYEFIYRAQISAEFYSRGTEAAYRRRKGLPLRYGDRTELDGNDLYAESADTVAERNQGYSSDTYDGGRAEGLSGRAVGGTDRVHRSDEDSYRGFSSDDESIGEGSDREHQADNEGYRETGWENERVLFERSLFGEGDYGTSYEEDVSDLYDSVRGSDSIGTDTLYLIGGIGNLIDEDAPVEDCTTMHQRKERKKYNGPVMGGM